MHILLVADGRSPITRNWLRMLSGLDHTISLVSTYPYEPIPGIARQYTLPVAFSGMSGSQVFDCIREIRPQMPVLLSSGYSLNGQAQDIMAKGCNGFLQKPFNLAELSQKIYDVMHLDQ